MEPERRSWLVGMNWHRENISEGKRSIIYFSHRLKSPQYATVGPSAWLKCTVLSVLFYFLHVRFIIINWCLLHFCNWIQLYITVLVGDKCSILTSHTATSLTEVIFQLLVIGGSVSVQRKCGVRSWVHFPVGFVFVCDVTWDKLLWPDSWGRL